MQQPMSKSATNESLYLANSTRLSFNVFGRQIRSLAYTFYRMVRMPINSSESNFVYFAFRICVIVEYKYFKFGKFT